MGWRDRERKREKRVQIFMSVFIAFIMILSVFGIMIGTTSDDIRYGKYKFTNNGQVYLTKINGADMPFYSLPNQFGYVNITEDLLAKLKAADFIVLAFDPNNANESLSYIEQVRFDLSQYLSGKLLVDGVLQPNDQYASLPIINCVNATTKTPILVFNVSDNFVIEDYNSCIYFNGRGSDFLRFRDALLYEYYEVI